MNFKASQLFSSTQVTNNKVQQTCSIEIASGYRASVKGDTIRRLKQLHDKGVEEFLDIIPQEKQSCQRNTRHNNNEASNMNHVILPQETYKEKTSRTITPRKFNICTSNIDPSVVPNSIHSVKTFTRNNVLYTKMQYSDKHKPFVLRGCAIRSNCVTTVLIQSFCIKGVCYYTIFTVIIYSYYMNIYW